MQRKTLAVLPIFLIWLTTSSVFGQAISFGISAKASTMGFGGDAIARFNDRMAVRAGLDMIGYERSFLFSESDIDYEALLQLKTGSLSAVFDYYIARGVFVTGGIGLNRFNVNTSGHAASDMVYGDISIPPEKIGSFLFEVRPGLRMSPYLGIGFGRSLSLDNRVGFAVELGTYYQGSPDVSIQTDGLLSPTSNPDHGQKELFERQLSQYYLYPVLRISLSVRIADIMRRDASTANLSHNK